MSNIMFADDNMYKCIEYYISGGRKREGEKLLQDRRGIAQNQKSKLITLTDSLYQNGQNNSKVLRTTKQEAAPILGPASLLVICYENRRTTLGFSHPSS